METIYSRFNKIEEAVEESKAYTAAVLEVKFHSQVPKRIRNMMASRYMVRDTEI